MMFQFVTITPGLQIGAVVIGLAIAVILHEVAHGYVALQLGDPTAKYAGRLTLNPIKHIDLWGTIIVPLFLLLLPGGLLFGWAKPVPVNYYNLRNGKYGPLLVALAGPATNLLILIVTGLLARFSPADTSLPFLFGTIALINGWLMMFNLIPVPPLDGSKVLYVFLERRPDVLQWLETYGFYLLIALIFFAGSILQIVAIPALYLVGSFAGPAVLQQVLLNVL
jgi:Zn-dependent protease